MKIITYYELDLPDYSLAYLINGDASGLEDEDKEAIDEWHACMIERCNRKFPGLMTDLVLRDDDEGSFCRCPEFGLACTCVDAAWIIWAENDDPRPAFPLPWEDEDEGS